MHVLGIDPGQRATGIVLLEHDNLLVQKTISTDATTVVAPDINYISSICSELEYLYLANLPYSEGLLVALEGIVNPTPFMSRGKTFSRLQKEQPTLINTSGIAGAAAVAGAVAVWARNHDAAIVVVEPSHNGSGPPFQYPRELHDPRGGCSKGAPCDGRCTAKQGSRRHVRSAWDVALTGATLYKHESIN